MTALTVAGKWKSQAKSIEVDRIFWDDLQGLANGAQIMAVLTTESSIDQLKWYWWMLGEICKAGYWDGDKDSLDDYTRIGVGFGTWRPLSNGQAVFVPNSIALPKLDDRKRGRYLYYAERLWAERLGVDVAELKAKADQWKAA